MVYESHYSAVATLRPWLMFSPGDTFSLGAKHHNTLLQTCQVVIEGVRGGGHAVFYEIRYFVIITTPSYLAPDVVTQ